MEVFRIVEEDSSKHYEKAQDVLSLLCGKEPPVEMIERWDCHVDEDLQHFVADNMKLEWAQAIECIDSAFTIAGAPREDL